MFLKEKKNNKPLLIGITGGIGSGKSTVTKIFNALGVKVYNSDIEAKKIINSDFEVISSIKQKFGEGIYKNNLLNSKILAEKVFNNSDALNALNAIVHPKVKLHFESWVQQNKTDKILIKEAAILIESGAYKDLDRLIVINSPEELRISRVSSRDHLNESEVKKRIAAQLSDEERLKYANYVINNNEKDLVIPQVLNIYNSLYIL